MTETRPPYDAGRPPLPTYQPPQNRSTAFFVALFLGVLLLVSIAVNVVMLVISVGALAGSGLGTSEADGAGYELVHVAGSRDAQIRVLQVPVHGAIAETSSPVLGAEGGTVSRVVRALRVAAGDETIRGVLLAIDSPGGGVTDSDEIYRAIQRFRREHPDKKVLALFGDMAASGGYYVAAAAERIMARRTSITGSIGVIMSAWNFAAAAEKLGIEQVAIKSPHTPLKDMLSPTRPMTDDERRLLEGIVEDLYQQFVTVVDDGRPNLDRDQVQALATGAIYTANQALQNGLIDAVGEHDDARKWFEEQLGGEVRVLEHRRLPNLRDLLFGAEAKANADSAAALLRGSTGPRFLFWWSGAR